MLFRQVFLLLQVYPFIIFYVNLSLLVCRDDFQGLKTTKLLED